MVAFNFLKIVERGIDSFLSTLQTGSKGSLGTCYMLCFRNTYVCISDSQFIPQLPLLILCHKSRIICFL